MKSEPFIKRSKRAKNGPKLFRFEAVLQLTEILSTHSDLAGKLGLSQSGLPPEMPDGGTE